jgi:AcrR family transcriptional regulator
MVTPSKAGEPRKRPDRRALLIEAAGALFKERAYDEVTATEIAQRAGVAYGLIAHHFTNKRGLYLATLNTVAEHARAVYAVPPAGDTPAAQLRDALTRHVTYVEDNAERFIALMRGGIGSDPEVRALIEDMRWRGATCLLGAFGVTEPFRPALRTTMRGWTGYVDASLIDHLDHHELTRDDLVSLLVATLIAALRTARGIDSHIGIEPALLEALSG